MNIKSSSIPPARNPQTHSRHRREVFWQIILPLILVSVVLIILAVFVSIAEKEEASLWADIALIWLISPLLLISFLALILLIGNVYLVFKLMQILPNYFLRIQDLITLIEARITILDNQAVEPILRLKSLRASLGKIKTVMRIKMGSKS